MAHFVFSDGFFEWNSVDLSDHVKEVRLTYTVDFVEEQRMGSTTRVRHPVIKDWRIEVMFYQDYAASEVDATLSADILSAPPTSRTWKARPDKSDAVGATNPNYQATGYISEYEPINGQFGELLGTRVVIVPGGSAPDLVRSAT